MTLDELNIKLPTYMDPSDPNITLVYGIINDNFIGYAINNVKRKQRTLVNILEDQAMDCVVEKFSTSDLTEALKFINRYMKGKWPKPTFNVGDFKKNKFK